MHRQALAMMLGVAATACGQAPTEPMLYVASSQAVASASNAPVRKINESISITAQAFSSCHNELIDVTGRGHIVESFFVDGRVSVHLNSADLTGTGESSGLTYNMIETAREKLTVEPTNELITIHYRAITAGSQQNDLLNMTVRIFADGNGGIRQEILAQRSTCVG